jgi:hypothetical protein
MLSSSRGRHWALEAAAAPSFAHWSAISFPSIPLWHGNQWNSVVWKGVPTELVFCAEAPSHEPLTGAGIVVSYNFQRSLGIGKYGDRLCSESPEGRPFVLVVSCRCEPHPNGVELSVNLCTSSCHPALPFKFHTAAQPVAPSSSLDPSVNIAIPFKLSGPSVQDSAVAFALSVSSIITRPRRDSLQTRHSKAPPTRPVQLGMLPTASILWLAVANAYLTDVISERSRRRFPIIHKTGALPPIQVSDS